MSHHEPRVSRKFSSYPLTISRCPRVHHLFQCISVSTCLIVSIYQSCLIVSSPLIFPHQFLRCLVKVYVVSLRCSSRTVSRSRCSSRDNGHFTPRRNTISFIGQEFKEDSKKLIEQLETLRRSEFNKIKFCFPRIFLKSFHFPEISLYF